MHVLMAISARYPDAFYRDATSGAAGLYTVAAVDERQVVGVVVGSIVKVSQCDQEVGHCSVATQHSALAGHRSPRAN